MVSDRVFRVAVSISVPVHVTLADCERLNLVLVSACVSVALSVCVKVRDSSVGVPTCVPVSVIDCISEIVNVSVVEIICENDQLRRVCVGRKLIVWV
jgi:hypothetical protein